MGRNYSQIYTYDGVGNLRDSGESILLLIFNMLDQTKRQIKPYSMIMTKRFLRTTME